MVSINTHSSRAGGENERNRQKNGEDYIPNMAQGLASNTHDEKTCMLKNCTHDRQDKRRESEVDDLWR